VEENAEGGSNSPGADGSEGGRRRGARLKDMSSAAAPDPSRAAAPAERGVIDLLGLLAYAELVSFFRLASDAELAPTLEDKAELAAFAATEQAHHQLLRRRLVELGVDPEDAMRPFVA